MGLNAGDKIRYRLLPDMASLEATVLKADNEVIVLRTGADAPLNVPQGSNIVVAHDDMDYYAEVAGRENDILRARQVWTGKRGYFRVNDVFPVEVRRADASGAARSKVVPMPFSPEAGLVEPDDGVGPNLWRILVDINAKLSLILDRLNIDVREIDGPAAKAVNISASGIRLAVGERYEIGDAVELRMFLPMSPPVLVIASGSVVRSEELKSGEYGIAVYFIDMDEDAQDVIIQYTLKRQRELVRRRSDGGIAA